MEQQEKTITIDGYHISTVKELCEQLAFFLDKSIRITDDTYFNDLEEILRGEYDLTIIWQHADVSELVMEEEYQRSCEQIRRTDNGHDCRLALIEGTILPEYTFDYHELSSIYDVTLITEDQYQEIHDLYQQNKDWFDYLNADVTLETIHDEARASDGETRFFVAFREPEVVGIANIILEYPRMDTVWIDSFMIRKDLQGFSYGSEILRDMLDAFTRCGFIWVQTGVPDGFPAAEKFWRRNWFAELHKYSEKDGVKLRHLIRGLQ